LEFFRITSDAKIYSTNFNSFIVNSKMKYNNNNIIMDDTFITNHTNYEVTFSNVIILMIVEVNATSVTVRARSVTIAKCLMRILIDIM
jgi:hypothetical protein